MRAGPCFGREQKMMSPQGSCTFMQQIIVSVSSIFLFKGGENKSILQLKDWLCLLAGG